MKDTPAQEISDKTTTQVIASPSLINESPIEYVET